MITTLVISLVAIIATILLIVFCPKIEIKGHSFQTFYFPSLLGALLLLCIGIVDLNTISNLVFSSDSINPIKILLLFISTSALSIVLDEVGVFKFLANLVLKKASKNQVSIFIILYLTTSILTVFTSNDVIILTFTPFIIFFCKNANVNPIPYLVSEFCAANTLSMLLVIGNPTNIYLTSIAQIDFFHYLSVMFLPTILATIVEFLILFLLFKKELKKEINPKLEEVQIADKPIMIIGIICLVCCTILLSISSYIGLEMYLISLFFASILFIFMLIYLLINKNKYFVLKNSIKRLPYTLIPFLLSMFVIVMSLDVFEINVMLGTLFNNDLSVFTYGFTSIFSCNLMNNIPMSIFYSEIIKTIDVTMQEKALFATVIGSNIGAFITPIGALAGIMWMSILKKYQVKYSFLTFIKYGVLIGIPTALVAFVTLMII